MSTTGTILLAAADQAFKELVGNALRDDEHTIVGATSGTDVLAMYTQVRPDLVLLDAELVGSDGLETCRKLVEAHGDECAPVVFFATNATPTEIAAAFAAGASDYLGKGSTVDEIRARAQAHLQNYVLLKQHKAMADQLTRTNAAKNRFIGMAAHDMRNPLVSIRGFSEFLMDGTVGPMPPSQLALVTIIHGTANLMIKTLNELLDVATIDAGQLKLQVSTHSLVDLVTKSVTQARIEARKKRSRIEFLTPAGTPVLAMDADKVKQVVDNLLSNAIKFSPPASVITVTVNCALDGSSCSFAVRDQGPGMPEQARQRLTKHTATLAQESADADKSAGLGLIICRNIVEAHGGAITAENTAGKGCEVRVTLPLNH